MEAFPFFVLVKKFRDSQIKCLEYWRNNDFSNEAQAEKEKCRKLSERLDNELKRCWPAAEKRLNESQDAINQLINELGLEVIK